MAIDLSNWDPIFRVNLTDDPPGKVITAEYWTSKWQASIIQGDHAQETLQALINELHDTAWHPTEAAATISSPAIYPDGSENTAGQLSELFNDLDSTKGDVSTLFTQVGLRRLLSEPLSHNDPQDIIGREQADSHPISAITDLQATLDSITAGAIGAFSHNDISNRDVADAHPATSITGLDAWQTAVDLDLTDHVGRLDVLEGLQHNDIPGRAEADTHTVASIKYNENLNLLQKLNNIDGIIQSITGEVSTLTHNDLDGRTANNAHPVSSITNLQTSLNAKQDNLTGGASTIASSNLTTNRALISNGSGKVAVSSVTSAQLGYVSGVTSAIQTQINNANTAINTKQKQITAGTAAPSGGVNGDVYIRYA